MKFLKQKHRKCAKCPNSWLYQSPKIFVVSTRLTHLVSTDGLVLFGTHNFNINPQFDGFTFKNFLLAVLFFPLLDPFHFKV